MKNKVLAVLLLILLIFQSVAFADYQFGTGNNPELIIYGEAQPGERVSFVLLNSSNLGCDNAEDTIAKYQDNLERDIVMDSDDIFHVQTVRANDEGVWTYTMPMDGIEMVELTLFTDKGETNYIKYASIDYKKGILATLKQKANVTDDGTAFYESLSDNIEYISDKNEEYNKITYKKNVALLVRDFVKGIDENLDTSILKFQTVLNDAILIESVKEKIETDLVKAMSIVDYDSTKLVEITLDGQKVLLEMLVNGNYTSVEAYKDYGKKQFALQHFNYNVDKTGDVLYDVFVANNNVIGIDLTEFNALTITDRIYAVVLLADEKSESVEAAQSNLKSIINSINSANKPDDIGGTSGIGGGSGGGGGAGYLKENNAFASSAGASKTDEYIQNQKYIFSDMKQADWATDAIHYLANKGRIHQNNSKYILCK